MPSPRSNHAEAVRIVYEYQPDSARVTQALVLILEKCGTILQQQTNQQGRTEEVKQ